MILSILVRFNVKKNYLEDNPLVDYSKKLNSNSIFFTCIQTIT